MGARRRTPTCFIVGVLVLSNYAPAQTSTPPPSLPGAELLGFEQTVDGRPDGWFATPAATVFSDETEKHGGNRSLRLTRSDESPGKFSTIIYRMPIEFTGTTIQLRGWLRKSGAGIPSLWMRQDEQNAAAAFVDMSSAAPVGEIWGAHSISFHLQDRATALVLGVRLVGAGSAWADDLELLVDGKPIAEVPRGARPASVLEADQQFSAGSGLMLEKLDAAQVEALVLTGKVWGFLKYHHPAVTNGSRHWDFELLRKLPSILKARKVGDVRRLLVDWIDALGPVTPCKSCATLESKDLHLSPRVQWIQDGKWLGGPLSERLQAIYRERVPDQQFFVSLAPNVGNPVFRNESSYPSLKFPDTGFQVLAIFRFWNIIEYWFPYRDLIDEGWDAVLKDSLSRAAASLDAAGFQRELMRLVARADDGHANVWDQPPVREPVGDCQLPVSLRYLEGKFVVSHLPADDKGANPFRAGDVLVAIDGKPVVEIANRMRSFYGASNESARMQGIARNLTRGNCGSIRVRAQRGTETEIEAQRVDSKTLRFENAGRNDRSGETFQMISPDVAYLKLSSFKVADAPDYVNRAAGARALIVDIRNYPSAFAVFSLGSLLVDEPTRFAMFTVSELSNPGAFRFGPPMTLQAAKPHFGGRVLILVDESSISNAEYTAMALRASPRAQIVGRQTAGADGNLSPIPFPGGFRAGISGIGVFYPDRRPTQQVGVKLDVECPNTIAGLRESRDETLDCALRLLNP